MSRILFVMPNFEDYVADGVFHGLRTLMGDDVVDFPKAEYLYDTITPGVRSRIRGGGFTLYGLLPDLPIDRDHLLTRALDREFDLVVFADIWRTWGLFSEWGPQLQHKGVRLALIDGSDRIEPYPFAGVWWRRRAWWFVPRAHRRGTYFKREITDWMYWFRSYLTIPGPVGRRLGLLQGVKPISFSIPADGIVDAPPPKTQEFATHVVDEEVAQATGGQTSYAFADEAAYRADLRASRFGITTKRAGWDCLRHYEIAMNGAVPCFRDLDRKPPRCAPHGLLAGHNCLSYANAADLQRQVAALDDTAYATLQANAIAWARASSTIARAREFLAAMDLRP
jgi:hypothetical protein